jgi:hypothetical protein
MAEIEPAVSAGEKLDIARPLLAAQLAHPATRAAALEAMEAQSINSVLALGTAPALVDVMASEVAEVDSHTFCSAALLLARLIHEADDPAAVWGAAMQDGRYVALMGSRGNALAVALSKSADELSRDDALIYACMCAHTSVALVRGLTAPVTAADFTLPEYLALMMKLEPMYRSESRELNGSMLVLLLELLSTAAEHYGAELPELAVGGAWNGLANCLTSRADMCQLAFEAGIVDAAAAALRSVGPAADWVSRSRGKGGQGGAVWTAIASQSCVIHVLVAESTELAQAAKTSLVASGLFEEALNAIVAIENQGAEGMKDVDTGALYMVLNALNIGRDEPGCQEKLRGVASSLTFCLDHSIDFMEAFGLTTGAMAAELCAAVLPDTTTQPPSTPPTAKFQSPTLQDWSPPTHDETAGLSEGNMVEVVRMLIRDAQHERMQARLEAAKLSTKMESLMLELTPPRPRAAISDAELGVLQARLDTLHAEELLTNDELQAIEDTISDFSDLRQLVLPKIITLEMVRDTPGEYFAAASSLRQVIGVSNTFDSNATFARQLRRKIAASTRAGLRLITHQQDAEIYGV